MLGVGLGLTQPRGRAGFAPTDIAGLLGWWDASDTATITESGGAVSQLDDKSGNSNHVVQATAASQPATGTLTLNGRNVLDFDGGDWLASSGNIGVSNSTNFNVFVVVTLDVANTYSTVFATGRAAVPVGGGAAFLVGSDALVGSRLMATDVFAPGGMKGNTTLALSTPYVLSYSVEPWSSVRALTELRLNGAGETETVYGSQAPSLADGPAFIGAFGASLATSRWNGQIAEVIVYDAALDATQVGQVEAYLAGKWGVTLA